MHAKRRAIGLIMGMMTAGAIAAGATAVISELSATNNYTVKSASSTKVTTTPGVTTFSYFDM
jgi:hypothetical protein